MLAGYLEALHRHYDARFLGTDPVQFPHRYPDPQDREVVALLAALFAFGNVTSICATVERILQPLGTSPSRTLKMGTGPLFMKKTNLSPFHGFVHRWVTRDDLLGLLAGIGGCLAEWGSLKACFLAGYDPAAPDLGPAMSHFIRALRRKASGSRGLGFLLSDPASGSACKRLHMFLRWVVRPADGIDLGLWPEVHTSQLLVPMDTHLARISRFLGLSHRATVDGKMAREVTTALRQCDRNDPVKYDFALARIGIVAGCRGYRHPKICPTCPLDPVCRAPTR